MAVVEGRQMQMLLMPSYMQIYYLPWIFSNFYGINKENMFVCLFHVSASSIKKKYVSKLMIKQLIDVSGLWKFMTVTKCLWAKCWKYSIRIWPGPRLVDPLDTLTRVSSGYSVIKMVRLNITVVKHSKHTHFKIRNRPQMPPNFCRKIQLCPMCAQHHSVVKIIFNNEQKKKIKIFSRMWYCSL